MATKRIKDWTFGETLCALWALIVIGLIGIPLIWIGGFALMFLMDALHLG